MSRASKRSRSQRTARAGLHTSAPSPAREPTRPAVSRVRPAPTVRPSKSDPRDQLPHLGRDVRRTFLVAGICLVVVIAAYFAFR